MRITFRALGLFSVLVLLSGCSSAEERVLLRWKLPLEEPVAFYTSMNPVSDEDRVLFSLDPGVVFGEDGISDESMDEALSFELPEEFSMTSVLEPTEDGNISVKMIMGSMPVFNAGDSEMEDAMNEMMKAMQGTVQLRGEIAPSGEVTSFYLESKQKNLLALFFQLPAEPVEVGDTWSIDVNLVAMGQGFICDKAEKTNNATLVDIEETENGETVATIQYVLAERVEGLFVMPLSMMQGMKNLPDGMPNKDKEIPSVMEFTFVGEGRFLVEEGIWETFSGRMGMFATGIMESDGEQEFVLKPMDEVPEKLLDMK